MADDTADSLSDPHWRLHLPHRHPPLTAIFIGAFLLLMIVVLGLAFSRGSHNTSARPAKSPRLIHTHGRAAEPVEIDYDDTGEAIEVQPPAPKSTAIVAPPEEVETFDDGHIDPVMARKAIFDAWRLANPAPEAWTLANGSIRSCALVKFVNGFEGKTPEEAIDVCLDHFDEIEAQRNDE